MTDPDQWARVEALFDAAWEQPEPTRRAWLQAQAAPPEVAAQVARLLDAAERSGDFLEADAAAPAAEDLQLAPGDRAGAWRVLAPLGRGGMGEVYEVARADGQFEQHAALKLIRRADAGAWERFQNERRILARLEHPGIARLIDGGLLADGQPYMVMERVAGAPVDAWCERRGAGLRERVALVRQAAQALAHAHQRLVVHRDLSPGNLLVDEEGRVRLIDFGVARLADAATEHGGAALSPDYAAPEQARGDTISTATDIWGLAAVLYRLVAGQAPRDTRGLPAPVALARIAAQAPVPLLATEGARRWSRRGAEAALLQDLDAILGKALQPEPADRYASAADFDRDLALALDRDVVGARAGSARHRLARRVHRHRWGLAGAVAAVGSLALGLGLALWQAREAALQRDEALREQARLEAVQQAVFHMFRAAGELQGSETSASDVLDSAARRIQDGFARDPAEGAPILHALGELYFLITDYEAAGPLLQRLAEADPAQVDPALIAAGRYDLAQVALRTGDAARAGELLAQAQAFWRGEPARWESRLVDSRLLEAQLLKQAGDAEGAIALLREALARRIAISGASHRETGVFHNNLGVALFGAGRLDEARTAFEAASAVWRDTGLDGSPDALNTLNNWGAVELSAGRPEAAEPLFGQAVELRRRHYGPSAATAALLSNYGKLRLQRGDAAGALPLLQDAAAMGAQFAGAGSLHHVAALAGAVEAEVALDRLDEAERSALTALDAARATLGDAHPGTAMAMLAMARVHAARGRAGDAAPLLASVETMAAAMGPTGTRLAAQAAAVRARYRLPAPRPGPGTATPSP